MGRAVAIDPDTFACDIADLIDRYGANISEDFGWDEIRKAAEHFLIALGLDHNGMIREATVIAYTPHTCNNGRGPMFGRLTPDRCERCAELSAGAPRRPMPDWVIRYKAVKGASPALAAQIKAHFGKDGPHDRGECGPVCTEFQF